MRFLLSLVILFFLSSLDVSGQSFNPIMNMPTRSDPMAQRPFSLSHCSQDIQNAYAADLAKLNRLASEGNNNPTGISSINQGGLTMQIGFLRSSYKNCKGTFPDPTITIDPTLPSAIHRDAFAPSDVDKCSSAIQAQFRREISQLLWANERSPSTGFPMFRGTLISQYSNCGRPYDSMPSMKAPASSRSDPMARLFFSLSHCSPAIQQAYANEVAKLDRNVQNTRYGNDQTMIQVIHQGDDMMKLFGIQTAFKNCRGTFPDPTVPIDPNLPSEIHPRAIVPREVAKCSLAIQNQFRKEMSQLLWANERYGTTDLSMRQTRLTGNYFNCGKPYDPIASMRNRASKTADFELNSAEKSSNPQGFSSSSSSGRKISIEVLVD